ncbi:WD repeat-containing protein 49, partial [Geodia barretti]
GGGARLSPNFEMEAVGAISELAQSLRGCELRRITRSDFETTVRKHLSGSHADQQIAQLWDKVSRSVTARWLIITKAKGLSCAGLCGGRGTIGQGELCSFLLREMQQRESTARAHLTLPLPHLPTFSSMPNTKDTVCAVLGLSTPPQYLTVSKDGSICTWSTRFHLQQSVSIGGGHGSVRGRQGHGMCITSCVMIGGTLVLATTGRDLLFYDTVSLSCLHKFQKLPFVPLCLTYGVEDEKYATSPGHLVWGDESGCVGILSFAEPHKSFFRSRLVTFNGVTDQAPLVRIRYEKAHSDWVCQVGWTGPAHYVISAAQSSSPSLLIQHVSAHRKKYIFKIRMGVSCFDYSHRLEVVATGSLDHIVRLWTPFSPHQPVASLSSHTTGIVGVAIDERSTMSYVHITLLQFLCVWDIREHHLLQTVSVKFPFTQRQPDFGPSPLLTLPLPSPTLNISCNEYMARFTLNEAAGLEGEKVDTGHTHPVCAVFFIPHFDQLVSGCEGGEVRVWDISSRRTCMKVEGCHRDQELTALAVDTEGGRILTGSRFGAIKVWDSLTGQNLQSLETPGATEVVSILHHPEMRRFLATGWNRQISVFEDKKLQLSPEPAWAGGTPHCDDIITMDYCSPYYLATGSFDGLTVVWNTDTERIVAQFRSQLKRRDQILTSATLKSPTSQHPPSATNSLSTSSRPASRRLSSYRLKSASRSHLHHVPVDKLLFLKTRVKSKARGQSTLVTSEGGHAFFWDMFSSGPPLGLCPPYVY